MEQVVARWRRPVASRVALGHAASGDAACIASTPRHGHKNEQRWRCICLSQPPFLLGVIVAKNHVMAH
jgi:hypothetical protein